LFYFYSLKKIEVRNIEIIHTAKEMQARSDRSRRKGQAIVFVPTMGYLHAGHLSLMRLGLKHGNDLVLSIFVNPTQFGPGEDLDAYPRDMDRDIELARKEGAGAVFAPDEKEIYGHAYQTYVALDQLSRHLCGISRPIHFRGVATVCTKLFNIVNPHVAVFGQKDFQQLLIIRRMVQDLNFDIAIIGAPIVREPDGLAMSSRNTYLTPAQRIAALTLYASLQDARRRVESGEKNAVKIIAAASELITSRPETTIDYIAVCDPETLDDVMTIEQPVLMALAVKVGPTRLIDNMILTP
jgi:pantoate--beta-alanine ligase